VTPDTPTWAGWDLYTIQQRIGHESIKTTFDVYGHRISHGDTERLDALDQCSAADVEGLRTKPRSRRCGAAYRVTCHPFLPMPTMECRHKLNKSC
jgi:hypothetical protein